MLIGSDLSDPSAARREVAQWASTHGWRVPRRGLRLAVIRDGAPVQEWFVGERVASTEPDPPQCAPRPLRFAPASSDPAA